MALDVVDAEGMTISHRILDKLEQWQDYITTSTAFALQLKGNRYAGEALAGIEALTVRTATDMSRFEMTLAAPGTTDLRVALWEATALTEDFGREWTELKDITKKLTAGIPLED